MDELSKIKKYKLKLIEDCAQAHGSFYKNNHETYEIYLHLVFTLEKI